MYTYKVKGSLLLADFITSLNDKPELLELTKQILKYSGEEESNTEAFEDYLTVIKEYNKNQEIKRLKDYLSEA